MADQKERNIEVNKLTDIDPLIHAPARLLVMTYLYVVESLDFVYLKRVTDLSWGNLSTHLTKLEDAGYVKMKKSFQDKKPKTMIQLTKKGRKAFRSYKDEMQQVLGEIPD
jgi:DNA-binding MarR family transcriptional regulator